MASTCPRCHRILEEDEICCAQLSYTWRCRSCFKLTTGVAIPYGRCFLCGGRLEIMADRDVGDSMMHPAIRDAVQFELDLLHFYRLAEKRAATPEQRIVLESLSEAVAGHLFELKEKYRAQPGREMVKLASNEDTLQSDWPVQGLRIEDSAAIADLYQIALRMERRARDRFQALEHDFPAGLENELCKELEAEEDEHIAMLETELAQIA